METNRQAVQNETSAWYEVQIPGKRYPWVTLSDHNTREQAETAKARLDPTGQMNLRVHRVRGQA